MATDRSALSIIAELRDTLPGILEKDVAWFYEDFQDITQEDQNVLDAAETPKKRNKMLLRILHDKGEAACGEFINNIKKMLPSFPELAALSPYLNDYRRKTFLDLMMQLNLKSDEECKLTLSDILTIGPENLEDDKPKKIEDLPRHFLRRLMALNTTARNTSIENESLHAGSNEDDDLFDIFKMKVKHFPNSIHPLDVLCALLHCSDSLVQGEIVSKLSMCQFAVPLLLPAGDGSHCTLMLGAMRDIVKRWKPKSLADSKGFREEAVVNIPMPIFSFVRLGKSKLSKSKILNQVLNPVQQHHNFFIHYDMEGGTIERKISDGLVEMSWYFPCGKSDVYPEPITVTNLRGDLETNWDQFKFLTRVSSAVFIFIESISEREFRLLSSSSSSTGTQYYFIVTPSSGKDIKPETLQYLKQLMPILNLNKTNMIANAQTGNTIEFVEKIQNCIRTLNNNKQATLECVSKETHDFAILVDEKVPECQKAEEYARSIIAAIGNVEEFKKKSLILQGDLWKKLSEIEKELCRMKKQGGKDTQEYHSELESKQLSIRTAQNEQNMPDSILLFVDAITNLTQKERQIFLRRTKLLLDSIARENSLLLQEKYKNFYEQNREQLKQLDQSTFHSSLGIEHFFREIGQIYESECYVSRYNSAGEEKRQFIRLPGIAADLMLDGFPLELIDGDASNIPLQWITDVLSELDKKTGGQCKMRVISVLGVQSTGKSTLLNTMFGLQFPVASGRCTRGAFMTLLKVNENFHQELGCQFILVIDTEGLKAPELSSLEGSYEHDNELATLVVALSDITIINMAMETTTDMKDILQIVVHAFLRMTGVGKKPNCQFVHHNVSDVSAHNKNMRDRKKLLDLLDEMTKLAAKMEKQTGIMAFGDVMNYDFEKHNWYIPGLFQGVPPMASVNIGYSENVYELKTFLFKFIKTQKSTVKPLTIWEFIVWMEDLWRAVKHEKFIFSFKNSLVADAYNKLCSEFSQWEWQLSKKVNNVVTGIKNNIKNHSTDALDEETYAKYKQEVQYILVEEQKKMMTLLEQYYENRTENNVIEEYRKTFALNISDLIESRQRNALIKCKEAFNIQKGKSEIQNIQSRYQKVIEDKITELLKIRSQKGELSDEELQKKFDTMWENTLSDLHFEKIKRRKVSEEMLQELRQDMKYKGSAVQEKLGEIKNLSAYTVMFKIQDNKYFHIPETITMRLPPLFGQEHHKNLKDFVDLLSERCNDYVTEKVTSSEDYTDMYCKDLLHMIQEKLNTNSKKLNFTPVFELSTKLFILANAAQKFEKLHTKFIEENDPIKYLNRLKPEYFLMFQNIFQEKDECLSRAKLFCDNYLQPAIDNHILEQLGGKIVDDILSSSDKEIFTSRTCFQFTVLQSLLEDMSFKKYLRYIQSYEQFLADWILQYIVHKYQNSSSLRRFEEEILDSIEKEVTDVLNDEKCLQSEDIGQYLENVCEMLNRELVINREGLKTLTFHSKANVEEFSSNIKSLLKEKIKTTLSTFQAIGIEFIIEVVSLKPQQELLKKVIGCGKQCPFCKAPCEDGGTNHEKHSASIHRPEGLGRLKMDNTNTLATGICTTSVASKDKFKNADTEWKCYEYKKYEEIYPDWEIKPYIFTEATNYWKFIYVTFNKEFAKEYDSEPAILPPYWKEITKEDALYSLKKVYHYAFEEYPTWLSHGLMKSFPKRRL